MPGTGHEFDDLAPVRVLAALEESDDELSAVLAVLRAAGVPEPEGLPVADGDRLLLQVDRALHGHGLQVTVTCPGCGTVNQVELDVAALPPSGPRSVRLGPGGGLREPTYGDLLGLTDSPDAAAALLALLTVGDPPRPAAADDLAGLDRTLDQLLVPCVECGREVVAEVAPAGLVLTRLQALAAAADREIHLLAAAYHWDLAAIEALPAGRRRRLATHVAEGK